MNQHSLKLPVIVDLQPESAEQLLRLPTWMMYLFVLLYLGTLVGLGLLLKESIGFFQLFQANDENLDWALQMEADRMVNSFVARKDLDTEMTVVRNEYENGENSPFSVTIAFNPYFAIMPIVLPLAIGMEMDTGV